jgi:hypothetical protein
MKEDFMKEKDILDLLSETTFLLLTLHALESGFPDGLPKVSAVTDFPYEPMMVLEEMSVFKTLTIKGETVLVMNKSTLEIIREFLRIHFPEVFPGFDCIRFDLPSKLRFRSTEKIRAQFRRLPESFHKFKAVFSSPIDLKKYDRCFYERVALLLVLAMSVTRVKIPGGKTFYITGNTMIPEVLRTLEKMKLLKYVTNDSRGQYVVFTEKGRNEGKTLVKKHFPDASPELFDLYSPNLIRRLIPPMEQLMTSIAHTVDQVTANYNRK